MTLDSQQVAATDIGDLTMAWLDYRHGLRASEVCDLQWHQVELDHGRMHVRRAKNGTPSVHPIWGDEICLESPTQDYVSVTERGRSAPSAFTISSRGSARPPKGSFTRRVFPDIDLHVPIAP